MKVTSKKLLIICGKMPDARWDKMKNSGPWPLNSCLLANAQKAPAKNLHQQKHHPLQKNLLHLKAANSSF